MRNPHAGQPFTATDDEIAEALLDVSVPTLMLSLVHMSGDPELIRGDLKPAGLFLNEVQGYMSEEDKAAVRKIALEVIADYRDRAAHRGLCRSGGAGRPCVDSQDFRPCPADSDYRDSEDDADRVKRD